MNGAFGFAFVISGITFFVVSVFLLSGDCANDHWNPQYISTQLAACLDTFPAVSWIFVVTLEIQTFLILVGWENLFRSTQMLVHFESVIIACAATLIISLACVVEFREDRTSVSANFSQITEQNLHITSAISAMVSFGVMHALMGLSLLDLSICEQEMIKSANISHENSLIFNNELELIVENYQRVIKTYIQFDKAYFVCIVVFFVAWPFVFTMAVFAEWLLLIVGASMHVYSIVQITRPVPWINNMKNTADRSFGVLTYSLLSFICSLTFSCGIFIVAPFSMNDDSENLHSSLALLLVVVTTYVGTGIILSHIGEHKI